MEEGDPAAVQLSITPRYFLPYFTAALSVLSVLPVLSPVRSLAQDASGSSGGRRFVPVISGGAGFVYNVNGGVPGLAPQIAPVLLVPFSRHLLLESRTNFGGFFERQNLTSGPFKGTVYKATAFSQLDWLASKHITAVGGRYLLPFGLYNERLSPFWISNLQDAPLTAGVGTRTTGAGVGGMLRGSAVSTPAYSVQYSAYFSALSTLNQFDSARAAGGDASVFLPGPRLEVGGSYQRFLQTRNYNSGAVYVSWQPPAAALDLKAEFDGFRYGRGYWLEPAYRLENAPLPAVLRKAQVIGRVEQIFPQNGGGNTVPTVRTSRVEFGLNYYLRDDLRLVSSYGRSLSSAQNANVWNVGFTYRFLIPLWSGGRR